MKKFKKIMFILLIFVLILSIMQIDVQAISVSDLEGTPLSNAKAKEIGNKAITILTTVGSVVSVVVLIFLGLKYMMGSIEERAEYKKSLMPYVIGCALVFMANVIATIIYKIITNL